MQHSALVRHLVYAREVYTPPFNTVADADEIRAMVRGHRSAWLVTVGQDGLPAATLLPILWRDSTVIMHMAKANDHWRGIAPGAPGLVITTGSQAYISPTWYAAKAEHGKVVPTWNYSAVQLTGTVQVHNDPEWLRAAVSELTDTHESGRAQPWSIDDAPPAYLDGQLRGIVGIEFTVTGVEGKTKLSQNRSEADQRGVIAGLAAEQLDPVHTAEATDIAADMQHRVDAS